MENFPHDTTLQNTCLVMAPKTYTIKYRIKNFYMFDIIFVNKVLQSYWKCDATVMQKDNYEYEL